MIGRIPHSCEVEEEMITEDSFSDKNSDMSSENRKKFIKSITDPKSPFKVVEENIRRKAA